MPRFNARFDATMQNETFGSAVQLSRSIGVMLTQISNSNRRGCFERARVDFVRHRRSVRPLIDASINSSSQIYTIFAAMLALQRSFSGFNLYTEELVQQWF